MSQEDNYRIKLLERQMKGIQRQVGVLNARMDGSTTKNDRRIRDLEIKMAVQQGVSQTKVAKIYDLSAGRVNQIIKKVA